MTLLHVILRGIRYRPGRSVVVLALAAVATAAAVMTPAYTSAAHQSLLTDTLTDIPTGYDGARFAAEEHAAEPEAGYFTKTFESIDNRVAGSPGLSPLRDPVHFAWTEVAVTGLRAEAQSKVAYREGLCDNIRMVAGECRADGGEVLVSQRSAAFEDLSLGDSLSVGTRQDPHAPDAEVTVAGIYEPKDASAAFWGGVSPLGHSIPPDGMKHLDALFVTSAEATATVDRPVRIGVDYRLDAGAVRLSNADRMSAELVALDKDAKVGSRDLKVDSRLTAVLKDIESEQDSVSASVPMVTIPLLLLAWFVLYLVVARLSEERAPQIALAKLRGHRFTSVTGFGTGEAAVLIVAGAPVGVLLGWALVEVLAWSSLAPGASVTFTPDIPGYAAASLLGGWAAVLVASRRVLTLPVLVLLRRVPARMRWRAGVAEGALVALAAVGVWQVLLVPDAGAIGLLVTPLLALVAGIVAARLLELRARRRLPAAIRKGRLARMLALAQVARRPETRRMVVLVTVASAVVTFGVCAWDVSEHNRELTASDELGADRVYTLSGGDPEDMMETVEKLDPEGTRLMAVMRRIDRFDSQSFTTVAVQSDRLAQVAKWRDMSRARLDELADALHPKRPEPLTINGRLTVTATVDKVKANHKPSMVARVVDDGGDPETLRLGKLSKGTDTYSASSPRCSDGCRLIGVGISRHPGDFDEISAVVRVSRLSDDEGPVESRLDDCSAWQPAGDLPADVPLRLDCSDGLAISVTSDETRDFIAEFASTPRRLPVAVAGPIPAGEVSGDDFQAMGPQGDLQRYHRDMSVPIVPRGGTRAMVVDLEYTNQAAQNFTSLGDRNDLRFEIWANDNAQPGVAEDLAEAGFTVAKTESRDDVVQRLSRAAPALSLRLYVLASGLALLLVIGAVLLTSTVGAAVRGYDSAALAVAGIDRRTLRNASIREHLQWIAAPAIAGIGAGLGGLALVLPSVPLVSSQPAEIATDYGLRPLWPSVSLAVVALALAGVGWLAVRIGRVRGAPERLRDSES